MKKTIFIITIIFFSCKTENKSNSAESIVDKIVTGKRFRLFNGKYIGSSNVSGEDGNSIHDLLTASQVL